MWLLRAAVHPPASASEDGSVGCSQLQAGTCFDHSSLTNHSFLLFSFAGIPKF